MELKFNNEVNEIVLNRNGDSLELKKNGESLDFTLFKVNDHTFSVRKGGKSVSAWAASDEDHFYVFIEGRGFVFDKVKEEEKSFDDSAGSSDRDVVKPPMPGSIVKVEVEPGQKVKEGDALIIVEAMKMESVLYSSIDGVVSEVNVKAGEQVDADKILLIVEKES